MVHGDRKICHLVFCIFVGRISNAGSLSLSLNLYAEPKVVRNNGCDIVLSTGAVSTNHIRRTVHGCDR